MLRRLRLKFVVINLAIAIVCMVVVLLVIGKLNHSMNRHSQRY